MIKKIMLIIAVAVVGLAIFNSPVLAAEENNKGVETAILNECGKAEDGVMCLLKLTVDIMFIGVGILGVIGILIVGVQYLTAGGNEEQVRKSKRRLLNIVIGLAVCAVLYAILRWLLPGFEFSG